MTWLRKLRLDPYLLMMIGTVALASVLPARGMAAEGVGLVAKLGIALLFFLHGARLSRKAMLAGLAHWRLHLTILAITFLAFPLIGLSFKLIPPSVLPEPLVLGLLFLCCLPSTVQSSIGFTSIARGNIAAALCSASASNLLGMALTPILAGLILHTQGGFSLDQLEAIGLQLLAPFIAGQVLQPWIGAWVEKNKRILGFVDRGSILLVVYAAFGEAVVEGVWSRVSALELLIVGVLCAILLALALAGSRTAARAMGFNKEDEIAVVFCGTKKSIVTGVPMAAILFPAATAGVVILPVMLFHQMQLMACAVIAQRYAARDKTSSAV
ncbi:bile acid:sodium symporter [Caulobacter segnis]|uniref:bile acid:sodium symporter family protein n=1 Tax=Caulobacter segnis TaxID=88688 RepID=UPI00240F9DF2|nr:bile acid:sodium symporter family protein [Caulobacter segnis]MDG2522378.1 bile acid:sodium symporter [Caulobacter segnis]